MSDRGAEDTEWLGEQIDDVFEAAVEERGMSPPKVVAVFMAHTDMMEMMLEDSLEIPRGSLQEDRNARNPYRDD